jgi:hypothetical protein
LIAAVLLFGFYVSLGAYLALVRHYLPYDALARLVSAYLVYYGTEIKLATIGFVWPPIPTLLLLPLAWVKILVHSWLAVVIVSALATVIACLILYRIARLCGLSRGWGAVVTVLFALNPLMVVFGANGMSEAILVAATLAGFYWLVHFWITDRNLDVLMAAGFFSLLPLIRYEAALLTLAAGMLVLLQTWSLGRRRFTVDALRPNPGAGGGAAFSAFLEGRLLGFSGLAIYPIFLWAVASWMIMGSPLYFLANDRSSLNLAEMQIASYGNLITDLGTSFKLTLGISTLAFPLAIIAAVACTWIGIRSRRSFLIGVGVFPLILPAVRFLLLTQSATVPLLRYFIMVVPLGVLVSLVVWKSLHPWLAAQAGGQRWRPRLLAAGFLVLFAASNLASARVLLTYEYQNIERSTWLALTTRAPIPNPEIEEAIQVGVALTHIVPPGSRVLLDTYQFGFAVVLGAGDPKLFFDFTDPHYDQAVRNPVGFVDYVLVPATAGRGAFYSINRFHPNLHAEGAPWAEWVEGLPETGSQWRLYRVKRP